MLLEVEKNEMQTLVDACIACAQACNKCFRVCLEKQNLHEMKEVLSILVDCAEICYVTAAYVSNDNLYTQELSRTCIDLCEKCADICQSYEDLHCQASVKACRHCAEECRRIMGIK